MNYKKIFYLYDVTVPLALPTVATPLSTTDAATFLAVSTVPTKVSTNKNVILNMI